MNSDNICKVYLTFSNLEYMLYLGVASFFEYGGLQAKASAFTFSGIYTIEIKGGDPVANLRNVESMDFIAHQMTIHTISSDYYEYKCNPCLAIKLKPFEAIK